MIARQDLAAYAERLWESLRFADLTSLARWFRPDAYFWRTGGPEGTFNEFWPAVRTRSRAMPGRSYNNLRRTFSDEGFVQQHSVRWTASNGTQLEMGVCLVVKLDDQGLISRFDEYTDTELLTADGPASTRHSLQVVQRFIATRSGTDAANLKSTLSSWDCHFAFLRRSPKGLKLRVYSDISDAPALSSDLDHSRIASVNQVEAHTAWYAFYEAADEGTGPIAKASRGEYRPVKAAFLPIAEDGVIGEVALSQAKVQVAATPLQRPDRSDEASRSATLARNSLLHQEFVRAWARGDWGAMQRSLAPTLHCSIRIADRASERRELHLISTRQHFVDRYRSMGKLLSAPLELNVIVSMWYIFAEYELEVTIDGTPRRRKWASLYPVDGRSRLLGQLVYAVDELDA